MIRLQAAQARLQLIERGNTGNAGFLPDEARGTISISAPAKCGAARPDLAGIRGTEGLVIGPDGTIYYSQPFGPNATFLGRFRPPYDKGPENHWAQMPGNAFGITLDPRRQVIYAGSRTAKMVFKVTLDDTPKVTELAPAEAGINGVTLGRDGAVYYTDQSGGHVYSVTLKGVKTTVTKTPLVEPNGLAFGPDGQLYVLSWTEGTITRLRVSHGAETARESFATLPKKNADGIAFDSKGRLYITASKTLFEVSADGKDVKSLGSASGANVEFGVGALNCTDIYTAGGALTRYTHDTPGFKVPWHQ
ncbi:MAG TPA: SMP-30/gluconolactonase/LRE family protein [Blastocatellia bacterium]|nr:SMP-30/gluconolactonase/LRE family protein [Blastocatellia bacterium]